jgi:hypothetical protein
VGRGNGGGRRGAVVVRAAQLKMPSAKMVDSKSPAAGYHFGSGDVDERQSEEANRPGACFIAWRDHPGSQADLHILPHV